MSCETNPRVRRVWSLIQQTCWIGGCIITMGYASKYARKIKKWEVLDPSHHLEDYKAYMLDPVSTKDMGFRSSVRAKQQKEWDRINLTLSVITATSAAALAIPPPFDPSPYWFTTACFSAGFGLSLEGLILITYLTVFASNSSPETIGRVAKGKHILKGSAGSTAFVTALPTAITTYASLFLLAGLLSMTIMRGGKAVEERAQAFMAAVLAPVGLIFTCCVGAVTGCEVVAANEARIRKKRAAKQETMMADVIRARVWGAQRDEEATVGISHMQGTRKISDIQVAGASHVLAGKEDK